MTNREKLLDELAALDDDALYMAFADNRLTTLIDDMQCADCHRIHGDCPARDDDDVCPLSMEDWLHRPCERESLILEVKR